MTAAEGSFLGFAQQSAKGVPNVTDANFKYLLFNQGAISPSNVVLPTNPEVGGGSMIRDLKKMGVMSGGGIELIPRPDTLGYFLKGALGSALTTRKPSTAVHSPVTLTGSTQNITTGMTPPNSLVRIKGNPAGLTLTGNVTITGTVAAVPAQTDVIALNGGHPVLGTKIFTAISSIDYPVRITTGDTVDVTSVIPEVYEHEFFMGADQFAAPYFTFRSSPGGMWGEQYQDCRFNALGLEFRGANFVNAAVGVSGGLPAPLSTTAWGALAKIDAGPQFITPVSSIALPAGTPLSVLSGSFQCGMAIPLDEQWVVGSYSPEAFDIVSRSFAVNFVVKVTDGTLYNKMMFDPAGGSAWAASLLREAAITFSLKSDTNIVSGSPYELLIEGNGANQASGNANIVWSVSPIGLRAGRQVVMAISGLYLADPLKNEPVTIRLRNITASYA